MYIYILINNIPGQSKKFVSKKPFCDTDSLGSKYGNCYPQQKFKNGFNLVHVDSTYPAFSSDGPEQVSIKKGVFAIITDFSGSQYGKLSPQSYSRHLRALAPPAPSKVGRSPRLPSRIWGYNQLCNLELTLGPRLALANLILTSVTSMQL